VRLSLPSSLRVHPVFHMSKIKPVSSSPLMPASPAPPTLQLVDGHPQWTVRRLLKVRRRGRGFQYLADWEGYGPEERSWISRQLIIRDGYQEPEPLWNRFPYNRYLWYRIKLDFSVLEKHCILPAPGGGQNET